MQRTLLLAGDELTADAIAEAVAELGEQARDALSAPEADLGVTYELRYQGQAFELAIAGSADAQPDQLREAFEAEHEDRYGYSDSDQVLELVTIRVTATVPGAEVTLAADGDAPEARQSRRQAIVNGEQIDIEVVRGDPAPGTELEGPSIVELAEATLLVADGWSGGVDDTGTIRLERKSS